MGIDVLEYDETLTPGLVAGVGRFRSAVFLVPFPATREPVGEGYDLFIRRKSSRVIRPSGDGV